MANSLPAQAQESAEISDDEFEDDEERDNSDDDDGGPIDIRSVVQDQPDHHVHAEPPRKRQKR